MYFSNLKNWFLADLRKHGVKAKDFFFLLIVKTLQRNNDEWFSVDHLYVAP